GRGVGERVHFLGVRVEVAEMLAACDLFALSSHWEGNPMAVMEAMAAGLPVVATAVGSVPELVVDGETGLLVPDGQDRAFAGALASLARDPGRRQELGAAAVRRAAAFSVDGMVASYSGLFERLAGAAS
ncbi:MAG: glycosyltransferase, partial [Candidatus Solibacter sp.]|nr:glycosyltransferase [Candidatus Solibacter sp.]